ncbi:hypothetical protein EPN81_01380 [Patescibacteria group bacterium]|nr:MAG: hypothetical protein EPN81_01380 [Patescibacteria group bacterium]
MKSTFFHVALIVIGLALLGFATTNFTALKMISQQITNLNIETENPVTEEPLVTQPVDEESELVDLLYEKSGYRFPFGAAQIKGYYTTVERATSLDDSTPTVTCSAFVVTDGPKRLMESFTQNQFDTPPTVVIGSEDSSYGAISESTEESPITVLVMLNPVFEGGLIGCMAYPFSTITEIE